MKYTIGFFCTLLSLYVGNLGAQPLPYQSPHQTQGTVSCASSLCHGAIETWKDSTVLQNEYVTWSRSDKHARSYAVLLNERSKEIGVHIRSAPFVIDHVQFKGFGNALPGKKTELLAGCAGSAVLVSRTS